MPDTKESFMCWHPSCGEATKVRHGLNIMKTHEGLVNDQTPFLNGAVLALRVES